MKAHFVTFYSPGTFFAEETTKPIESWDVETAKEMAKRVVERYNQKPFAFEFTTRSRAFDELDSKAVKTSKRYYLGGRVMTLAEVEKSEPADSIILANMRCNDWAHVIRCSAGNYQLFEKGDQIV